MSAIAAKKIFDAIQSSGANVAYSMASQISFGVVTSVSPLTITREGDDTRTPIPSSLLVLSPHCKPFSITTTSHRHTIPEGVTSTELQEISIWKGLQKGEKVILMSFNSGQRFFVERVEIK